MSSNLSTKFILIEIPFSRGLGIKALKWNTKTGIRLKMTIIICPGIHDPTLTGDFIANLQQHSVNLENYLIFPTDRYPAFSGFHLWQFLQEQQISKKPLTFLAFSAGVVAAIAAAQFYQLNGGKVEKIIALDGWGVPLWGNIPIYRCSHDYFTHWSSALMEIGRISFYADPPVEHLALWRSPHQVSGWMINKNNYSFTTEATFLATLLI